MPKQKIYWNINYVLKILFDYLFFKNEITFFKFKNHLISREFNKKLTYAGGLQIGFPSFDWEYIGRMRILPSFANTTLRI
jgi:hypothetical protein